MKKTIRLTESDLHRVIEESVKKILNESVWYGSTEPFETIIKATSEIMDSLSHVTGEDYEPWDDCDGRDLDPEIYEWAKRVNEQAEDWMRYNSSNSSINGGEPW